MRIPGTLFVLSLAFAGCGSPATTFTTTTDMAVAAPTFTELNDKVIKISCALSSSCHDNVGMMGGLDLQTDPFHALVNVTPTNPQAVSDGMKEVKPGDLDKSFVWKKVNLSTMAQDPNYGYGMPYTSPPLDSASMNLLRNWILAGAPNN